MCEWVEDVVKVAGRRKNESLGAPMNAANQTLSDGSSPDLCRYMSDSGLYEVGMVSCLGAVARIAGVRLTHRPVCRVQRESS